MVAQLLFEHLPGSGFTTKGAQNLGVVIKMSALFIEMTIHEHRYRVRRLQSQKRAKRTLDAKVPNRRLHISGEHYVH